MSNDGPGDGSPPASEGGQAPELEALRQEFAELKDKLQGREHRLVKEFGKFKEEVRGSKPADADPAPQPKEGASPSQGLTESQVAALISLGTHTATLEEAQRELVHDFRDKHGVEAAAAYAAALAAAKQPASGEKRDRKPARAASAAQPPAATVYEPDAVRRMPPAERQAVLAQIRKGEASFRTE